MKYFIFIILASLGMISCNQDDINVYNKTDDHIELSDKLKTSLLINDKNFNGKLLAISIKSKSDHFSAVGEIDWNIKSTFVLNKYRSLEVPYLTTNNTITLYDFKTIIKESDQDRNMRVAYSYSNLVYFENNIGYKQTLIITYIPESGVIEHLKYFKTGKRMSLNNIDKNFTGYIEYKKLDGEVISVEYFIKGKMLSRYFYSKSTSTNNKILKIASTSTLMANSNSTTSSQTCTTVCTPRYGMVCASVPEHTEGESCTMKVIGEVCSQVCVATPPPDYPSPGGGGTSPSIPSQQTRIYIETIFEPCANMAKGSENYDKFLSEVQKALDTENGYGKGVACFTEKMLQFLSNQANGSKIALCLDGTTNQGAYNPMTKVLKFKDNFNIDGRTIVHELFHICQDKIYPNGISQYTTLGEAEIEFETHMFLDIISSLEGKNTQLYVSSSIAYSNYIEGFVTDSNDNRNLHSAKNAFNSGSIHNSPAYLQFKEAFKNKYPNYSSPNYPLEPIALKYFFNNFNCFQ